jgi:hypothetical protein
LTSIIEEDLRHKCEVRQVLKWRVESRSKAVEYLALVRKKRGDEKADKLEKDCREQWAKGSRGEAGVWIE